MKRILLALTMVGFLLPLAPRAQADAEVSLNFFYDNLSSQGSWIEVGDYGYCFQPNVAVSNSDWRPYSDGYWAYTDAGWTWVSYEDFGWATYHYGRWADLDSYGWVWVPGYEWAPAWVSWRTGGDYVGWAPLPPSGDPVYEGRAITSQVDAEFGIGPLYYNFVDVRYIGEPVLRGRILAPSRNVTIINQTVNVTNITYNNSIVYNYGPDYNRLNQYSSRPIQRLTLQRETTVGANLGQGGKGGNFNRVSGNQLTVVAPPIQKSQQPIAPKQVKAKVEKPTIDHGWKGVQNRQQLEAQIKQQNPKNIAAPSFQPQKGRKREVIAGAEQTAGQGTQAPAEQKQGAAPNAAAADQPAQQTQPAQQNDQNAKRAEAQRNRQENQNRKNRRGESATAPGSAAPEVGQQAGGGQSEEAQQAQNQKSERQQKAQEHRAQQAGQNDREKSQADREQGADHAPKARKAQQAERNQQSEAESPHSNRAQRAEPAQEAPRAQPTEREKPAARSKPAQQEVAPGPPPGGEATVERPQRPHPAQTAHPAEPAQPRHRVEQGAQSTRGVAPAGEAGAARQGKGKRKKPAEEPSPSP
jgi:hypothetical protein